MLNDLKFAPNSLVINERITFSVPRAGPILESKGMCAIFQKKCKKRAKIGKIFENLDKNVQNLRIFWKRAASCMQLCTHETARICPVGWPMILDYKIPWFFQGFPDQIWHNSLTF